VDKDNKLVVNEAKVAENPVYTINGISSDVQTKLVKNRVRKQFLIERLLKCYSTTNFC